MESDVFVWFFFVSCITWWFFSNFKNSVSTFSTFSLICFWQICISLSLVLIFDLSFLYGLTDNKIGLFFLFFHCCKLSYKYIFERYLIKQQLWLFSTFVVKVVIDLRKNESGSFVLMCHLITFLVLLFLFKKLHFIMCPLWQR